MRASFGASSFKEGGERNLDGNYFYYDGHSSQEFGLIITSFSQSKDTTFAMSRDILMGSLNRNRKIPNFMGTEYQGVLVFTISLIKDPCDYPDGVFNEEEVDDINAWLTSPQYPTLLYINDEDPYDLHKYEYFAICSDVTPQMAGAYVIGFDIEFTTNAPYAWTPEIVFNFSTEYQSVISTATLAPIMTRSGQAIRMSTGKSVSAVIDVNSSEKYYEIYPVIRITPNRTTNGTTRVTIISYNDGYVGTTLDVKNGQTTTMDCARAHIYNEDGTLTFSDVGIEDVGEIYWPRLYNGTNSFVLIGNAEVTMTYREPRKVGSY